MRLYEHIDPDDLVNEAEKFVLQELESRLDSIDSEYLNEDCLLDMAAYALNNVSPRYRVNLLGRLISGTLDPEYQQELSKAVDEAVKVVTSNPGA